MLVLGCRHRYDLVWVIDGQTLNVIVLDTGIAKYERVIWFHFHISLILLLLLDCTTRRALWIVGPSILDNLWNLLQVYCAMSCLSLCLSRYSAAVAPRRLLFTRQLSRLILPVVVLGSVGDLTIRSAFMSFTGVQRCESLKVIHTANDCILQALLQAHHRLIYYLLLQELATASYDVVSSDNQGWFTVVCLLLAVQILV